MKKFLAVSLPCLILASVFCFLACQEIKVDADVLKDPSFDPFSGTRFEPSLDLTITNPNGSTAGCVIRYTTSEDLAVEPADPTEESPIWEGATLDRSMIVKARAFAASYTPSGTVTATFYRVWTRLADMPEARCNHAMVAVGNYIYVIGGYNSSGAVTNSTYMYNTTTNEWNTMSATLTIARARHAVAVVGTKIFVFGGYNGISFINSIEVLDISDELPQWGPTSTSRTLDNNRADFEACTVGGIVYLIGGIGFSGALEYYDNIDSYDPVSDSIVASANALVNPTAGHCIIQNGGTIYAIAGMQSASEVMDTYQTAQAGGTWSTNSNRLSANRIRHACAKGEDIIVFGGKIGGIPGDMIERLSVISGEWTTDAFNTPSVMVNAKAATCSGDIYLCGGASEDNDEADYNALYLYSE